jgi:hypothetical protein
MKLVHASIGVFLGWILASIIFWAAGYGAAFGAEVAYEFVTVDVAGTFPTDIDDDGTLLANGDKIVTQSRNVRKNVSFACDGDMPGVLDSYGAAISNGRIVGYCTNGAMVRQKDGTIIILSALGENAIAFGITKEGTVGGQFCTPNGPPNFGCTLHGFTWHPDRGYKVIDYIDGRLGSKTWSHVIAPISNGQILGEYFVLTLQNEMLEQGYWIYDNGFFDTTSLPKWTLAGGGDIAFIQDMNDLGQVVVQRWGSTGTYVELFDDGILFKVTGWPPDWYLLQVNGANNKGQFVGFYSIQVGFDPIYNWPIYAQHGFVATPAPEKRAKGNR